MIESLTPQIVAQLRRFNSNPTAWLEWLRMVIYCERLMTPLDLASNAITPRSVISCLHSECTQAGGYEIGARMSVSRPEMEIIGPGW